MAWQRPGDKPLAEPMVVSLLTHICAIRPKWFNQLPITTPWKPNGLGLIRSYALIFLVILWQYKYSYWRKSSANLLQLHQHRLSLGRDEIMMVLPLILPQHGILTEWSIGFRFMSLTSRGLFLLKCFNFNPSTDKWAHLLKSVRYDYLFIPKLQRSLGMDK